MQHRRDLSAISLREWQWIKGHAEAALVHAGGTHDWEDVLALLVSDKLQLWTGRHSVMMTEVVEYPRLTACRIFLAGGNLHELIEMAATLESEAAAIGCSRLEVSGRPGWAPVGERLGWQSHGFCTKEIGHGQ